MPKPSLRRLRRYGHTMLRLAREEREQYAGALHPSMWRRGFLSNRLYIYPGIEDPSLPYINDVRIHLHSHTLNTPAARTMMKNKLFFADALEARGMGPWAPHAYGTLTDRGFRPRSAAAREHLLTQKTVVLKPVSGMGGEGVRMVPVPELEGLGAEAGREYLVQERLVQHPELRRISPGSLNTARLLSVRLPGQGDVLAAATHRFGTAASWPVDNVAAGGLDCGVDVTTGRMGPLREFPRDRHRVEHDRHPDTGAHVTGTIVPQWPEVRQLAQRLMIAFPELDHVGWDIAVTDRGPRVVEGNADMPALMPIQMDGPFLNDPRLREYYVRHGLLSPRPGRLTGK
jgi:hypothetical protein